MASIKNIQRKKKETGNMNQQQYGMIIGGLLVIVVLVIYYRNSHKKVYYDFCGCDSRNVGMGYAVKKSICSSGTTGFFEPASSGLKCYYPVTNSWGACIPHGEKPSARQDGKCAAALY